MITAVNEAINRKLASMSFTTIVNGIVESIDPLSIRINDRISIGLGFIEPKSLGISDDSPNPALPFIVGDKINMIRYNNGQRFYILGAAGGGGGTLDTTNTTAQTPSAEESFADEIKLHKVSKTGSYNDLNDKPIIPSVPAKATGADVNAGTDDAKYVTSKAISDSNVAFTGDIPIDVSDLTDSTHIIPAPYTLPAASTTVLGGVKIDGTTVTIDENNVISAVSSSSLTKATGAEINTGTDNTKYVTSKAISDSNLIRSTDIKNNLTTTSSGSALDARQGKILNDKISNLMSKTTLWSDYTSSTTSATGTLSSAITNYDFIVVFASNLPKTEYSSLLIPTSCVQIQSSGTGNGLLVNLSTPTLDRRAFVRFSSATSVAFVSTTAGWSIREIIGIK